MAITVCPKCGKVYYQLYALNLCPECMDANGIEPEENAELERAIKATFRKMGHLVPVSGVDDTGIIRPQPEKLPDILILEGDRFGMKMVALDISTGITYTFRSGGGYGPECSVVGGPKTYMLAGDAASNLREQLWQRSMA